MEYLSNSYPSLYVEILEQLKMTDTIEKYMAKNEEYEDDVERYSWYIHGYFLIWLH